MKKPLLLLIGFFSLVVLPLLMTGCFALPEEDVLPLPPMIRLPESAPWQTTPVSRGDVSQHVELIAAYAAPQRVAVQFSQDDLEIAGIFVSSGDMVQEGQIIAALYTPELDEMLEEARLLERRLALEISHLAQRHALSLRIAEETDTPVDDFYYIDSRARMQEELDFLHVKITYLNEQVRESYVVSPISGVVVRAMEFIEGQVSSTRVDVAVIAEADVTAVDVSIFRLSQPGAATIRPGDVFVMTVARGGGAFEVTATAIDPEEYGIEILSDTTAPYVFLVVYGDYPFEYGTRGRITHVITYAVDVIAVPTRIVQSVEGRTFVYVMENGVRRLRYVETGFGSPDYTEIISGLEVGELIII